MNGFDPQLLVAGLALLATALFLIAVAPGFRHRRAARAASVAIYAAAVAAALGWTAAWLLTKHG